VSFPPGDTRVQGGILPPKVWVSHVPSLLGVVFAAFSDQAGMFRSWFCPCPLGSLRVVHVAGEIRESHLMGLTAIFMYGPLSCWLLFWFRPRRTQTNQSTVIRRHGLSALPLWPPRQFVDCVAGRTTLDLARSARCIVIGSLFASVWGESVPSCVG